MCVILIYRRQFVGISSSFFLPRYYNLYVRRIFCWRNQRKINKAKCFNTKEEHALLKHPKRPEKNVEYDFYVYISFSAMEECRSVLFQFILSMCCFWHKVSTAPINSLLFSFFSFLLFFSCCIDSMYYMFFAWKINRWKIARAEWQSKSRHIYNHTAKRCQFH